MKTLILTTALSFLACTAQAQDAPPASGAPPETVKKIRAAAWLGIGLTSDNGKVSISQVTPDSPAAKAGLKEGDVLLRIGETAVEGAPERVITAVSQKQPGDSIELRYQRGDKEESATIALGERPKDRERDFRGEFHKAKAEAERALDEADKSSGKDEDLKNDAERALDEAVKASEKALKEAQRNLDVLQSKKDSIKSNAKDVERPEAFLGVILEPGKDGKLTVSGLLADSPAGKAGLMEGDVLVRIGDTPATDNPRVFRQMIAARKPGEVVELHWQRGDKEMSAKIELGERPGVQAEEKLADEFREKVRRATEEWEKKMERLRIDGGDVPAAPDLHLEPPGKQPAIKQKPGVEGTKKQLRLFLDKKSPGDNAKHEYEWQPRFGMELPLWKWLDKKGLLQELKSADHRKAEEAVWERVQDSVAGELKKSGIEPDVVEKVMKAVEEARRANSEQSDRRAKLEAEAAKLEKEMQSLKRRADKLREELKNTAE